MYCSVVWIVIIGTGLYQAVDFLTDFAVADKKLGLSVLTATLLATAIGGGSLTGSVGNSFASGLLEVPKIIILLGINLFMALFVAKKMRNVGGFTAPELLGRVYGRRCQALGGLFCAIYMIGTGPAMQTIALGTCIHLLLGVNMQLGMIIGMGIVPLEFEVGESAESLGLTGFETYDIEPIDFSKGVPVPTHAGVCARNADGHEVHFWVKVRVDTATEGAYLEHGGILNYVLDDLLS